MTQRTPRTLRIFDVTEDSTGSWIGEAVDSGETTLDTEWAKMSDTDTTHYATHVAWQLGDEITTEYPGDFEVRDYGWVETEVAIRGTIIPDDDDEEIEE